MFVNHATKLGMSSTVRWFRNGAIYGELLQVTTEHMRNLMVFLFFILKNKCIYKKDLGNAHPALCSTFL
jgi:hypothetical protein